MTSVFQPIKLHYDSTLLANLSMDCKWQTLLPIKLLSHNTKSFLNQIELEIIGNTNIYICPVHFILVT